ncbi:unnamed protein product [Lampetra fluviatilis]
MLWSTHDYVSGHSLIIVACSSSEQQEKDVGPLQPPVGEGWRDLTGCLAHLLSFAAQLVVQLGPVAPARDAASQGQQADGSLSAAVPAWETAEFPPTQAAATFPTTGAAQQVTAILLSEREIFPAKLKSPSVASAGALSQRKCLPPDREFVAAGSNWTAFQRRFKAACTLVGWSDAEAMEGFLLIKVVLNCRRDNGWPF